MIFKLFLHNTNLLHYYKQKLLKYKFVYKIQILFIKILLLYIKILKVKNHIFFYFKLSYFNTHNFIKRKNIVKKFLQKYLYRLKIFNFLLLVKFLY